MPHRRPSHATIVAYLALFVALGGGAYAVTRPPKNSVTSAAIKNGQVKTNDLGNDSVISSKVKDGSLLGQDFASGQLPAGPTGMTGPQGPTGPSTGPAGGDLTGSYPNPTIRADQFTSVGLPDAGASCPVGVDSWVDWDPQRNETVGYYRDPTGIVHLHGLTAACGTAPTAIFTLPPGYRPNREEHFIVWTAGGPPQTGIIDIFHAEGAETGDGNVEPSGTSAGFYSLDGITFRCGPSGQDGCP